jgi:hypothetical protein
MSDDLHSSIPTAGYETALGTPDFHGEGVPLPYFHGPVEDLVRDIQASTRPDGLPCYLGSLVDKLHGAKPS